MLSYTDSCSPTAPCPQCAGDCDVDSDCIGSLICPNRNGGEPVPGCSGSDNSSKFCPTLRDVKYSSCTQIPTNTSLQPSIYSRNGLLCRTMRQKRSFHIHLMKRRSFAYSMLHTIILFPACSLIMLLANYDSWYFVSIIRFIYRLYR